MCVFREATMSVAQRKLGGDLRASAPSPKGGGFGGNAGGEGKTGSADYREIRSFRASSAVLGLRGAKMGQDGA